MDQAGNEEELALQDDAVLMEMLDQMPWVSMAISNCCYLSVSRDAQGSDDNPYYTNKYMEFYAGTLVNYVHGAETYLDGEE